MNSELSITEQIKTQIKNTETLLSQMKDKTTLAYLSGIYALKCNYESINDNEKACVYADIVIDMLSHDKVKYKDTKENEKKINDMWVHSYDTKARNGDYESFCIAMEWNRPINKQFFLPRRRLLEKHGVIKGIQDLIDDKLDLLVLNLPPRIGKELSDDTPVLTKHGWKNHGDLVVGDYVLNDKGKFVKVLALSPKCKSEYVISFSNGEKIECHGNHEWVVYDRHALKNKIIETKEMIGKVRDGNNTHSHFRFMIENREPIKGEYKNLGVKPYTLGAWLGDGSCCNPYITGDKKDFEIITGIVNDGYELSATWINSKTGVYTYNIGGLRKDLEIYNMCYAHHRKQKYIPDEYLTSTIEQRLDLLAGLLDTDGCLSSKEHRYHFSTCEKTLKDSFISLISTFGWRCSVSEKIPRISNGGIQGKQIYWEIGFNPTFEIPCRLKRKQLRYFSKQRRMSIVDISPIKEQSIGNCIQVEGGVYLAGRSMIPTHNSTIGLFLQAQLGGMFPDESILSAGHSVSLIQSFYGEMLNLITSEEYRYNEIFPNNKIINKSAEQYYIDLNANRRFHTYNFISIETGGTGKVQAERLLYCDDLVKNVEQANNPATLEKLYFNYTGTIKDRKIQRLFKDGKYRPCPEIHVNTPWSINDVTSRVVNNAIDSGEMDRVRIISVPCYDEFGESNFEYDYGKGFSTKYYKDMELAEDPVIFSAKYLMTPVERDGLVFNKDNVSFYDELPAEKPDMIVGYGDVTHGGEDYFSLPIGYVYGRDVYIEDVLFINKFGGDDYSRPRVCEIIMKHNVNKIGFEKNNGGDFYSTLINQDLRRKNYYCNITSHNAPPNKSKLSRILSVQNEIKGIASEDNTYRLYFKSPEKIKGNTEYQLAMRNLYSWNQNVSMQNKQHDDFPDSLAGLITNVLGNARTGRAKTQDIADKLGI